MAGLNFYQRILNRLSSFHNIDNSMKSPCSVPGKEMNSGDRSWTNEVSVRKLDLLCNHQFAFEFNYYVRNYWKIRLENCHRYERLTGCSWDIHIYWVLVKDNMQIILGHTHLSVSVGIGHILPWSQIYVISSLGHWYINSTIYMVV